MVRTTQKRVMCRDQNKVFPRADPPARRCRGAGAPSAWELFRGRSISGRVNIDSPGGTALVATPLG